MTTGTPIAQITHYKALALQTRCDAVNAIADVATCRSQMLASIVRIDTEIASAKAFIGSDLKLIVLPEYFLTSYPVGPDLATWQARACLTEGCAEYKALGDVARKNAIYLSGNAYEIDPAFPHLFFQVSFILDPSGNCILKYRRIISMYTATPHDVWEQWLAHYGVEALFPVVDTELGKLSCIASEEILFPEIARALCLRGAEVILHSSSEIGSPQLTKKGIAKRARAVENLAYVVSANSGGIFGAGISPQSTDGNSIVIDYEGRVLAEANAGESMVAFATLGLDGLRYARNRVGMDNYLARLRTEPFTSLYSRSVYPPNLMATERPTRDKFHAAIQQGIDALKGGA